MVDPTNLSAVTRTTANTPAEHIVDHRVLAVAVDALTAGPNIAGILAPGATPPTGSATPSYYLALDPMALRRATGKLDAALAARKTSPCRVAFIGSSTPSGTGASSLAVSAVALLTAGMQAVYPSGAGSEKATIFSTTGAFGTLSTAAGVHGYSGAIGGTTSADYLPTAVRTAVLNLNAAAIFHWVGSNDLANNMLPATYKANVLAKVQDLAAAEPGVLQVLVHQHVRLLPSAPTYPWSAYGQALAEIAAAYPDSVAFLDASAPFMLSGALPGATPLDPLDLIGTDGIHCTDAGHELLAKTLLKQLGISLAGTSTTTSSGGSSGSGVAPVGTVISADGFTRADGTTLGSTSTGSFPWTASGGAWSLLNGTIQNTSTTAATVVSINDGVNTGTWYATAPNSVGGNNCGIFFAGTSGNVGYVFYYSGTSSVWRLATISGTTLTALASGPAAPAAVAGQNLQVTRTSAGVITCKVDGTTVVTATDTTYAGTFSGLLAVSVVRDFDNWTHTNNVAA